MSDIFREARKDLSGGFASCRRGANLVLRRLPERPCASSKATDLGMGDQDQDRHEHVVLFECANMSAELKRRIQSHFKVRRKSGGGECGEVRRVDRDLYGVAFQDEEVKQRVLQRPQHIVEVPGGSLVLIVRDGSFSAGPSMPDQPAGPKAKPRASPPNKPPIPANPPPVNDEAKDAKDHQDEKQTSVRLVGEAKLRLLWGELEGTLRDSFPGVEVKQGNPGQLVLCGSAAEIRKAGNLVSARESSVLERSVSSKSPYFLDFLRKVYGGPGVLVDLFGLGDQVDIELGETELNLLSLSADKLDSTERKLEETFMELQIDVPKCSLTPSELLEKLESKSTAMNQGGRRVQVAGGPDGTVWVVGHAKEVQELNEYVGESILDQASVDGRVRLPFPELVQLLPHLLGLHNFDHSGVTLVPSESPSGPMVALNGPSGRVTEVRNRLGPLLDSLTKDRITINLAGALGYFESDAGQEGMFRVANSQRSLISLEKRRQTSGVAMYNLEVGLQVLLCQGDITQQQADALVNAANERLEHSGGVAAALSKAGGPQVQRESRDLVRRLGKVPTGGAVMTTGGNLKCKKLVHVVGPIKGKDASRDGALVEKAAYSALDLADAQAFKSIAIPCISSGLFGVPLHVCADGIVSAVKKFSGQLGQRSLTTITLIDKRPEAVRALKEACDRLLQSTQPRGSRDLEDAVGGASAAAPGGSVHVKVIHGTIQSQQVEVLVSPMVDFVPDSTRVGLELCGKAGPGFNRKFATAAAGKSRPGDIVVVENLPGLKAKAVVFIRLTPWNNDHGPIQVLNDGIRHTLALCESRGFNSVAFPTLGVGAALGFPHHVTFNVLQEEISAFEKKRVGKAPFEVRVVIQPGTKDSSKEFQAALDTFSPSGFDGPEKASLFRLTSSTTDTVTAMMGGLELQMVHGDIIQAETDVIVNTTDFSSQHAGVSKAILGAAGPTVAAELRVGAPTGLILSTGPGSLRCKEIIHASFKNETQTIRNHCKQILEQCESRGYRSVAFPAVNTGQARMNWAKACKAMLDGMAAAVQNKDLKSLALVRIVILQNKVFQAFRTELENRTRCQLNSAEKMKQTLKNCQRRISKSLSLSASEPQTVAPPTPQPAVMSVISSGPDIVRVIQSDLEELLRKQLLERPGDEESVSEQEAAQARGDLLGTSLEPQTVRGPGVGWEGGASFEPEGLKEDVPSGLELTYEVVKKGPSDDRDNEYVYMSRM